MEVCSPHVYTRLHTNTYPPHSAPGPWLSRRCALARPRCRMRGLPPGLPVGFFIHFRVYCGAYASTTNMVAPFPICCVVCGVQVQAVRHLSIHLYIIRYISNTTYLGVEPLPHLGAAVGDEHGPVLVHVHEGAALFCLVCVKEVGSVSPNTSVHIHRTAWCKQSHYPPTHTYTQKTTHTHKRKNHHITTNTREEHAPGS